MTPEALSAIRYAVCAIGWIGKTADEFYADPKRGRFQIEGTGFIGGPQQVVTCAHVVTELQRMKKKSEGRRPFVASIQFVYPPASDAEMSTAFRPFEVKFLNEEYDVAVLGLEGAVAVEPPPMVAADYIPAIGEMVGLCGYAHGSALLERGKELYRFGPVVQAGIVAALAPYDRVRPESAILDLVTGPAASGSPVFRQETGQIFGLLIEGQIKKTAALSIAKLIFRRPDGNLEISVSNVEMVRVTRG